MTDLKQENPCPKRLKLHQKFHKEIIRWLRQAFKWSGLQTGCKAKHRLKRGVYECGYCGNEIGPKQFEIDHENPCVAIDENYITGYNYTGIIERMFDEDNLVLSCIPCHRQKTGRENSKRKTGVARRPVTKKRIKDAWTDEMKDKAGSYRKGKKNSLEHNKKISKKNSGAGHGMYNLTGYKCPNFKGIWHTPEGSFGSTHEAAKELGIGAMTIHRRCSKLRDGKPVTTKYAADYIDWWFEQGEENE